MRDGVYIRDLTLKTAEREHGDCMFLWITLNGTRGYFFGNDLYPHPVTADWCWSLSANRLVLGNVTYHELASLLYMQTTWGEP